jgi:hypothetical protein
VGSYYQLRGKPDEAKKYWLKTMGITEISHFARTLAGSQLWDMGLTPTSYRQLLEPKPDEGR